jgi:hypothetical protein
MEDYKQLIDTSKNINNVISRLKKYGIATISSFIKHEELDGLRKEYIKIFETDGDCISFNKKHVTNKEGVVAGLKRKKMDTRLFPIISSLFSSSFMDDIVKLYFKGYDYELNDDIFLSHEKASNIPILPWHFDRIHALKFYFYLEDTNQDNGAFEYVVGSHREGFFRANYYLAQGIEIENIPNDIPDDEIINPLTLSAAAGDLIIFDTDGFHRGGLVKEGKERKVIRGHSHISPPRTYGFNKDPEKYSAVIDDANALIQHRIKYFGRAYNSDLMSQAVTRNDNSFL